ncbi:MAG: hypothetical protein J6I60_02665 [Bacteroidaceae bacterium]|nr:hypothetical protein [Bacteroidaceae bacterium]
MKKEYIHPEITALNSEDLLEIPTGGISNQGGDDNFGKDDDFDDDFEGEWQMLENNDWEDDTDSITFRPHRHPFDD